MEPLTYRQMADEIKAIGMEKADTLEKAKAKKRPAEMLAVTQFKIVALRQIWSLLDSMAKGIGPGEARGSEPAVATKANPAPVEDDDDF